jgi:hypothetical protein
MRSTWLPSARHRGWSSSRPCRPTDATSCSRRINRAATTCTCWIWTPAETRWRHRGGSPPCRATSSAGTGHRAEARSSSRRRRAERPRSWWLVRVANGPRSSEHLPRLSTRVGLLMAAPSSSRRQGVHTRAIATSGSCPRTAPTLETSPTRVQPIGGPNWSPDGTKIAFTDGYAASAAVYVVNVDGTGLVRLTSRAGEETAYGWSPEGSKVLFVSDRSDTGGRFLYMMDTDGSDVQLALRI